MHDKYIWAISISFREGLKESLYGRKCLQPSGDTEKLSPGLGPAGDILYHHPHHRKLYSVWHMSIMRVQTSSRVMASVISTLTTLLSSASTGWENWPTSWQHDIWYFDTFKYFAVYYHPLLHFLVVAVVPGDESLPPCLLRHAEHHHHQLRPQQGPTLATNSSTTHQTCHIYYLTKFLLCLFINPSSATIQSPGTMVDELPYASPRHTMSSCDDPSGGY